MANLTVRTEGAELCIETFGDPDQAPILLIGGASMPMDWWDADFCRRLADGGRFVIRYDHRDTGRSTCYPPGKPGYTSFDLAADAVTLIDTVAGGRAHVAGFSMGGGLAQHLAVEHPDRIATLTLLATSPGGTDLPPITDRLKRALQNPVPQPDWADRDAVTGYLVATERPLAGPDSFDETHVRGLARQVAERAIDLRAARNHWLILGEGPDPRPRLGEITAPTLVIHGTEDPLFPPEHARALAREIPGANLLLLDGLGHQVPTPPTWDVVIPAMLRHTSNPVS